MNSSGYSFRSRRGLTLTDLCVVLAALLMLVVIVPAIRQHTTEDQNRAQCAKNLANLFAAMQTYANTNNGNYPRTFYDRQNPKLTAYTGANDPSWFGPKGPAANDVTASIYLLMSATSYPMDLLVCPGSDAVVYKDKVFDHSNFPSRLNLSYSMQNPFPPMKMIAANWQWNKTGLSTGDPLFSDMNPGSDELKTLTPSASTSQMGPGNSRNHGGDGQNVLYGDSRVEFTATPFCGPKHGDEQDNIFTSNSTPPSLGVQGEDRDDAVMLPLATTGVQPPSKTPAVAPAATATPPAPAVEKNRDKLKKALEAATVEPESWLTTQRIVQISLAVVLIGAVVGFFIVRRRKQ